MTAATGFPTLRLIRVAIGPWSLENLAPGESCWSTVPEPILAQLKPAAPTPESNKKPGKTIFFFGAINARRTVYPWLALAAVASRHRSGLISIRPDRQYAERLGSAPATGLALFESKGNWTP